MAGPRSPLAGAVVLSVLAALGWASYYLFILGAGPTVRPSAALAYPFLFGGAAYVAWTAAQGRGRELAALFRSASAGVRIALLVLMQLGVLAATYLTGPVDAALLSLLGDVVATPIVVALFFSANPRQFVSAGLLAGLLLSVAGGTLAIVGGGSFESVPPIGWVLVPALPLAVAFYFVLTARAGHAGATTPTVAHSMLGAGLVTLVLAPLVPGGWTALGQVGAVPLALLAVNGLVSFFLAPAAYFRAIERVGLVVPPMMMTGIPVFTLALSAVFLSLRPSPLALLGIPVAVVGGIVTLWAEQRSPTNGATASR